MKLTNTTEQLKALADLLAKLCQLYQNKSSTPKYQAQRNLEGRTHYVDDGTLAFHHSRVLGTNIEGGGLFIQVCCSDALDMHNTRRGYRVATFDLFGTCLERPKLEEAATTSRAAWRIADNLELDAVEHYKKAVAEQAHYTTDTLNRQQDALKQIAAIA